MQIELAKSRGSYDKGVMFLDRGVTEVRTDVVWRHPQPEGGEVSLPPRSCAVPAVSVSWPFAHLSPLWLSEAQMSVCRAHGVVSA